MKITLRTVWLFAFFAGFVLAGCQKAAAPVVSFTASGAKQVTAAGVTFDWKITGPNIEIGLKAQTTGWVAVAFDPVNMMKGGNFIIGYVKDGTVFVADQFGNQLTNHVLDTSLGGQDNVTNASGKEENGVTEIRFTIPLSSGDRYDKPLGAGKHVVLLAHGDGDDFETPHKPDARAKLRLEL